MLLLLITVPPPLRSFSRSTPTLTLLLQSSLRLNPWAFLSSLQGKIHVPMSICPFFFGASLMAMTKREGGIRYIVVGCTLCRLAAKVAGFRVRDKKAALLAPCQLGYGVSGGAEAAVHAARLYMQDLQHRCVLKLDFRNAFNTLRWICSLLSTLPTHHPPPYSGVTKSSSLQKVCSRAIRLALSF